MTFRRSIIIIAGPTASGKSDAAMGVAEALGGEIVNADSIQVYRHFDIGSAKPTADEQARIPHHLIDILDPDHEFNARIFIERADAAIADIAARGKLPIVVGGTGLYIRCLIYGLFDEDSEATREARAFWEERLVADGLAALHAVLAAVDPDVAARLHPNDRVRIVRALAYHRATGMPISTAQQRNCFTEPRYDAAIIVPSHDNAVLLRRIEERTRRIFDGGIIDEVRRVLAMGYAPDCKPFQSIGYREALGVVQGVHDEAEAVRLAIRATKDYARRQRIWFRKEAGVRFVDAGSDCAAEVLSEARICLHGRC